MPPVALGTTRSKLCPPLSVSRSLVENPGTLASLTRLGSSVSSASGTLGSQGTSRTPPNVSEASTRWRSAAPSPPASPAERYCTMAFAICNRDCN